jgi:hypothetical protein
LKTEKKNRLMNIYLASSFSWATTRITWAVWLRMLNAFSRLSSSVPDVPQ